MPEYNEKGERMVTTKLNAKTHQAIKLLQKRYKMRRLDDALWQFLSEHDERLTTAAEKAVRFQERIEQDLEQEES